MTDYNSLKVPDLKKLLTERGLPLSGNKADLIARLQENDNKKAPASAAPAADDEIDWDEDDSKVVPGAATTTAAAATIAAGGQGAIETPVAVPNQNQDVDPSATSDLKVADGAAAPAAADAAVAASGETAPAAAEELKPDFSIGLQKTDAEKEAEKRAARAKKFGIVPDEEEVKKAERAKKFGGATDVDISGLDGALPERKKRVREEREGKGAGREAKRQTPDRRAEPVKKEARPAVPKKEPKNVYKSILEDPVEKAKAEARKQKFASSAAPAST